MKPWNTCGSLSERPALDLSLSEARREVMKLRLRVVVLLREIERGRPLTASEQLTNLTAALADEKESRKR